MNTKLTLSVNKEVIDHAKKYARSNNQSISALVQNYLVFITEKKKDDKIKISSAIKELAGIIDIDGSTDAKDIHRKYIMEKYS